MYLLINDEYGQEIAAVQYDEEKEKLKDVFDAARVKYPHNAFCVSSSSATMPEPAAPELTGKAAGSTTFDGSSNAAINVTSVNADTASKLSTARKINITGNASGSAGFDGSGNVSINTTVNESKHAAAATALDIFASRPSDANIQKGDGLVRHFLATAEMSKNKPPAGDGHILSFAWDNNGGHDAQLCVNNTTGSINTRGQSAGKWSDWLTVLDSANFNSYAPTKTGGGASGTWGINISGNAASATNADKVDGYHENSFLRYRGNAAANGEDTLWNQIGIKGYDGKLPKGVSGTYNYGAVVSLPSGNARLDIWYNHQCSTNKDGLWYRSGYSTDQKAWARLLDSNNYTNWAPTKTGGGASGTWGISITGNAKTATTASSVAWSGVTGKPGTYPPSAHNHDSAYPSVTGARASGTWGINISGNAASATNADKVDGYHASDIINRISAANTGGIVAASLTENGYAKFANGLILQWGTRTEPKVNDWVWVTTTFPITFASACFSVTCCDELTSTYDGDVEFFVRNIKTNSVDIRYRSDRLGRNLRWLALGV